MAIKYGTLRNANVTIDEDGSIWLWVNSGDLHAGMNLSNHFPDASIEEVFKMWARDQHQIQTRTDQI